MSFLSINRITYEHEWYLMRTIVGKPFTFSIDIGLLLMKHSWAPVSVHYMTLSKIRILPTVQTSSTTQQLQNEKNKLKNWSSLWIWGVFPICCQGTNCIKLTRVESTSYTLREPSDFSTIACFDAGPHIGTDLPRVTPKLFKPGTNFTCLRPSRLKGRSDAVGTACELLDYPIACHFLFAKRALSIFACLYQVRAWNLWCQDGRR